MNSQILLNWIADYGMAAVFLVIALEYACFPVPSELVLPFAGAFAARTGIRFFWMLLISVGAGLAGSLICYLIGYYGGNLVLQKWTLKHPKSKQGLDASRNWFEKYGNLSVMLGRVLPLCRTYISFIAGLSKQSPIKFLLFSAVGITVWNTVLTGLGYQLGAHWETVSVYAEKYQYLLLPAVIVLVFAVVMNIRSKIRKSSYSKSSAAEKDVKKKGR